METSTVAIPTFQNAAFSRFKEVGQLAQKGSVGDSYPHGRNDALCGYCLSGLAKGSPTLGEASLPSSTMRVWVPGCMA